MRNVVGLLESLCSAAEAAKIVGVTPQSVRVRVREKQLDHSDRFGVLVVHLADMLAWKAERIAIAQKKLEEAQL